MPRKKPRLERYMIRPVIYKTSSRFLCALTAALLWNEFVNTGGLWPRSRAFVFFGVLFAAAAVFSGCGYRSMSRAKLSLLSAREIG